MIKALWLLTAITLPPVSSFSWHYLLRKSLRAFFAGWLSAAVAGVALGALHGDWVWAGGNAVTGLAAVVAWWLYRRRGRKKAPRAYGAKSRALLAALVRKAREATKPRPVLRPVPQGGFR